MSWLSNKLKGVERFVKNPSKAMKNEERRLRTKLGLRVENPDLEDVDTKLPETPEIPIETADKQAELLAIARKMAKRKKFTPVAARAISAGR